MEALAVPAMFTSTLRPPALMTCCGSAVALRADATPLWRVACCIACGTAMPCGGGVFFAVGQQHFLRQPDFLQWHPLLCFAADPCTRHGVGWRTGLTWAWLPNGHEYAEYAEYAEYQQFPSIGKLCPTSMAWREEGRTLRTSAKSAWLEADAAILGLHSEAVATGPPSTAGSPVVRLRQCRSEQNPPTSLSALCTHGRVFFDS